MPNEKLYELAKRDLRVPLRLPFPYSLIHNSIYYTPALLIRPALGGAKNPSFIFDRYDALKKLTSNPMEILSVSTENMEHLTISGNEPEPFLATLNYNIFAIRGGRNRVMAETGITLEENAEIHANLLNNYFARMVARGISLQIDEDKLKAVQNIRRARWKLEKKLTEILNKEPKRFVKERQRLEAAIIKALNKASPRIRERVYGATKLAERFFTAQNQKYSVETMDLYIQSLSPLLG